LDLRLAEGERRLLFDVPKRRENNAENPKTSRGTAGDKARDKVFEFLEGANPENEAGKEREGGEEHADIRAEDLCAEVDKERWRSKEKEKRTARWWGCCFGSW